MGRSLSTASSPSGPGCRPTRFARGNPDRVGLHDARNVGFAGRGIQIQGQGHGKGHAGLGVAGHADCAAAPLGEFLDQGETDARTQVAIIGVFDHLMETVEHEFESSEGMCDPVFRTVTVIRFAVGGSTSSSEAPGHGCEPGSPARSTVRATSPPAGVNFRALDRRFTTTLSTRSGTCHPAAGVSGQLVSRTIFSCSAKASNDEVRA